MTDVCVCSSDLPLTHLSVVDGKVVVFLRGPPVYIRMEYIDCLLVYFTEHKANRSDKIGMYTQLERSWCVLCKCGSTVRSVGPEVSGV